MKKLFTIGIDPGVHTGIAIYHREAKRLTACETSEFWEVYIAILRGYKPDECKLFIEDASLINYTIRQKGVEGYQDRISRNAGRIQRECELLIEGFIRAGYEVVRVRPDGKKWNDKEFRLITKWQGRTSEHARDAARFCFGF